MDLYAAVILSANKTASLIIRDPADPVGFGRRPPNTCGTHYMWTEGHTVPILLTSHLDDMPPPAQQQQCVCGDRHGFPKRERELLHRLAFDMRWEPLFPLSPLEALAAIADG